MIKKIFFNSIVFPLFEINKTISFFLIFPKSPCNASTACIKIEDVPVEFNVATNFFPIIALLPIPTTTKRPSKNLNKLTTSTKLESINSSNLRIALACRSITSFAS